MSMCRMIWTATACGLLLGAPLGATPVELGMQFEPTSLFFRKGNPDERTLFVSIPGTRSLYLL